MAPVVWGLDLSEMKWSNFKSSHMWNCDYHRRRTKFIVYQLALVFCVVSESLGTAALSDYVHEERFVQKTDPRAYVFNNDYVGAAAYNICAGVFVAFIFGTAFFFDLFFPERKESGAVRLAWKICGVLAVVFHLAAIITLTVITAAHEGSVWGMSETDANSILSKWDKLDESPLVYKLNGRAIAALVFGWLGSVLVVYSRSITLPTDQGRDRSPSAKGTLQIQKRLLPSRRQLLVARQTPCPGRMVHPVQRQRPRVGVQAEQRFTPGMRQMYNPTLSDPPSCNSPTRSAIDCSMMTEDTHFSALALGTYGKKREDTPGSVYTLRKKSWAALTSGIADSDWYNR